MMQGDSYNIGIKLKNNAGSSVTPDDVIDVEITVGGVRKTYSAGEIVYSNGLWGYPVSQKDTFGTYPGGVKAQARVRWSDGSVEGKEIFGLRMIESESKEEI